MCDGLYPLLFKPIYKQKVWGGRTMEALGRSDLPKGDVGESWEVVDLERTSTSGGGGGSERSTVENGPLAGRTLHELMSTFGSDLMGDLQPNDFGEFPLLIKFLDAHDNLSVQVHPNAAYAATHEHAYLKSEAWYIIAAEPGAVIYKGMQPGTTPEKLHEALHANTIEAVLPLMVTVEVKPGACHYLPSGTCHALGAGVLAAEVQTPSDTTFRVFDWGRTGRELHIEAALENIEFGPCDASPYEPNITIEGQYGPIRRLVASDYFRMDELKLQAGFLQNMVYRQPTFWMMIKGCCTMSCEAMSNISIEQGRTVMLPPAMDNATVHIDEDATIIEVTFPNLEPVQLA